MTRIKKGSDRLDTENNNNSSDKMSESQKKEGSNEYVDEGKMQDIVREEAKRKEKDAANYPYTSQENVIKSGGMDHVPEAIELEDNPSSCEKISDVLTEGEDMASAESVEDTSQTPRDSRDSGSSDTASRGRGVESDIRHVDQFSAMDKVGNVDHSLVNDSSESLKEEANTVNDSQVRERHEDDLITDKESDHVTTDTNMDTKGISQNNLGQSCGNQVTEVINFHLDDTRGERSQFTSQNNPLQTAVVNS
jgi:hypothetical protein